MKSIPSDNSLFYLVSISLLTIMVLLLLFRRREGDRKAGLLLLVYFFSYLFLLSVSYVFVYGHWQNFIHLLRTGHISSLLMPVAAYFYLRQCLYPRKWQKTDLLHLLPVALYLVDFLPFFLLNGQEKASIFREMDAIEYRIGLSQGILMPKFGHMASRLVIMAFYWWAQFRVISSASKEPFHPLRLQSPPTWRWLYIFLFSQALIFLLPLVGSMLGDRKIDALLVGIGGAGTMAFQCFYLLLHPEILYPQTFEKEHAEQPLNVKLPLNPAMAEPGDEIIWPNHEIEVIKSKENRLSETDLEAIELVINRLMDTEQPFIKQGYTLRDFSEDTGISTHKLSAFINSRYGVNFNEFLNRFRVKQVMSRINTGDNALKTLEAIALEAGFNSRITFIRAFKKEVNMTPRDFVENTRKKKTAEKIVEGHPEESILR